ncbi:MAG: hypothetical protein QHH10_01565 [Peptococcaceae bacterium]|jgi:hypothetical protein|nr:hypothetical protein [Peptococcaceae bacterium]MDH7523983.1 hypothetical protein [Peptococcaceae bacterium]
MSKKGGMTVRFRGLSVREVDEFLGKLEKTQAEETAALEEQVRASREEKERLYQRLLELQAQRAQKAKPREFLELALVRAREAVDLLKKKAEEEAAEVIKAAREKNEANSSKVDGIESEIKATRAHIQSLLEGLASIFQEPEKAGDVAEQFSKKIIKFKSTIENRKPAQAKEDEQAALSPPQAGKEQGQQMKKMLDNLARVLNVPENEQALLLPGAEEKKERKVVGSGFWDSVFDSPGADGETASTAETLRAHPAGYAENREKTADVADEEDLQKEPVKELGQEQVEEVKKTSPTAKQGPADTADMAASTAGSRAVAAEINSMRYKYIAGKIAGEDLFDGGGKLIIARGEKITTEVIGRAEAEGKLPELIVNMVLPGMEE